jgi:hypothetical protein
MRVRSILEAGGFALFLVLPFVSPLLIPGGAALLHQRLAFHNPLLGVLVDIAAFSLVGIVISVLIRRLPALPRSMVSGFILGFVIWWAIFGVITIGMSLPDFHNIRPSVVLGGAQERVLELNSLVPMLFLGIGVLRPGLISSLVRKMRFALAAFSFSALWIVPQIVYLVMLPAVPPFDHSGEVAKIDFGKRIVWVLFDELSYKLAFEEIPHQIELPNFHKLALESSSFGNIQPAGYYTDHVVPALLAGKELDDIRSNLKGELLYRNRDQGRWQAYDPGETLFGIAHRNGWNPGVAGWFNAYCRMFVDVLTACAWQPGINAMIPLQRLGASRDIPVRENALILPRFFLYLYTGLGRVQSVNRLQKDFADYEILVSQSKRLIENGQIHFVFIHLPVPHPPGFFDRKTHTFCQCGNYLDNLVLADQTLGLMMHEIDQSPWAQQTTLIVSSDHSWRVPMWNRAPGWTPEEAAVSKGQFDSRPVFLVHSPGQTAGSTITAPVPELREYTALSAVLSGKAQAETFKETMAQGKVPDSTAKR